MEPMTVRQTVSVMARRMVSVRVHESLGVYLSHYVPSVSSVCDGGRNTSRRELRQQRVNRT
jgi:hypothetical protein